MVVTGRNCPGGNSSRQSQSFRVRATRGSKVGRSLEDTCCGIAILLVFVGVVLGASFVGAEFHLGSLTSQLLYEPRRWRVHLAKAATVGIGCAAFAALLCVVVAGLMLAGSELHGVVRGLDSSWWRHRGVESAARSERRRRPAIMAYSVTVVTHRTSAAIVVFLARVSRSSASSQRDVAVFGPISIRPVRAASSAIAVDPTSTERCWCRPPDPHERRRDRADRRVDRHAGRRRREWSSRRIRSAVADAPLPSCAMGTAVDVLVIGAGPGGIAAAITAARVAAARSCASTRRASRATRPAATASPPARSDSWSNSGSPAMVSTRPTPRSCGRRCSYHRAGAGSRCRFRPTGCTRR